MRPSSRAPSGSKVVVLRLKPGAAVPFSRPSFSFSCSRSLSFASFRFARSLCSRSRSLSKSTWSSLLTVLCGRATVFLAWVPESGGSGEAGFLGSEAGKDCRCVGRGSLLDEEILSVGACAVRADGCNVFFAWYPESGRRRLVADFVPEPSNTELVCFST